MDFLDSILDFLEMIWGCIKALIKPALGCLTVLAIPIVIIIIVELCQPWFATLPKETQDGIYKGIIVVVVIGWNISNYCHSYVWFLRKKWFFWFWLIASIIGGALAIGSIGG